METLIDPAEVPTVTPAARRRPSRRANILEGKEWLRNSVSVWSEIQKTAEERDFAKRMKKAGIQHPAIFPVELARRVVRTFVPGPVGYEGQILDPFCGTGTTVLAALAEGHRGVGFDVAEQYVALASERLRAFPCDRARLAAGSCQELLPTLLPASIDLCFTSPPYWDILQQRRTSDLKGLRDYITNTLESAGSIEENLSGTMPYAEFLRRLAAVFNRYIHPALKPGAYCVVDVMDLRKGPQFYPFHADLATALSDPELGGKFVWDDLIIWDRRHEYNCLRPLGYPAVFRVNKVHEYLLVLQKRRG